MDKQTEQFFAFLRYSMEITSEIPQDLQDMDWHALYDFAVKQCIVGIIYHGIQRLPDSAPRPDEDLEFQFYSISDKIRRDNIKLNMVAAKLTENLLKDGFRSCILKGQGNALMYPDPYMRTSGDIDIWVDGTDKEVIDYVRKSCPNELAFYHHIHYPILNGIKVELHYRPSYLDSFIHDSRLQRYIQIEKEEQFNNKVELPDNCGFINRPTNSFNRTYQMVHVVRHFMSQGVGLRQLIDYFFLLKQGFTEEERIASVKQISRIGLKGFTSGVIYILQKLFNLDPAYLMLPPNKKTGEFILSEILITGNMGVSEKRYGYGEKQQNRFKGIIKRNKKQANLLPYIPALCLNRPFYLVKRRLWEAKHNF